MVSYDRDYWDDAGPAINVCGELFDTPRLISTIEQHGVDVIVHTAAISHPDLSLDMPIATFMANVTGTVHLFEAARMAGVRRVVSFSSSSVYGHTDGTAGADTLLRPLTPYGVTKVSTELLGDVYSRIYSVEVISLRLTWVYGPGNRMQEIVRDMFTAARRRDTYRLDQGGEHPLPLIYVDDAAEGAVSAVLTEGSASGAYNVAGPELPTLGEVAARVKRLRPHANFEIGGGFLPLHRIGTLEVDSTREDLGFVPAWPLDRGLAVYADWLDQNDY